MKAKICSRCKFNVFRRVNREGWTERVLLTWLGIYPWECVQCRRRTYFKDDGHRPSTRGTV